MASGDEDDRRASTTAHFTTLAVVLLAVVLIECRLPQAADLARCNKSTVARVGQSPRPAVAPAPVWDPAGRAAEDTAQFGANATMKRPAQPGEIAPAIVFFASPSCASCTTGEILPIVGGY
jgi:hypothetical protein